MSQNIRLGFVVKKNNNLFKTNLLTSFYLLYKRLQKGGRIPVNLYNNHSLVLHIAADSGLAFLSSSSLLSSYCWGGRLRCGARGCFRTFPWCFIVQFHGVFNVFRGALGMLGMFISIFSIFVLGPLTPLLNSKFHVFNKYGILAFLMKIWRLRSE